MHIRLTDKYKVAKFRLSVVETLRLLKANHTYKELARITGLPETVLCRYVRGNIIPSTDQAENIWKKIEEYIEIKSLLEQQLVVREEDGFIDLGGILGNPRLMKLISYTIFTRFAGKRISKILTPETRGIPLATSIALTIDVPLVIARRSKENPFEEYYEESIVHSPTTVTTYYVPRNAITRRDSILIVDDFVQTGRTVKALARIVEKARAMLSGVVVLFATNDEWAKDLDTKIEILLKRPIGIGFRPG